jgi:uncharacterized protein
VGIERVGHALPALRELHRHASAAVRALALTCAVTTSVLAQRDNATFTAGTAVARRGGTAMGALVVPAGTDSGVQIPIAVINGARPGPVLALIAGSHGTEYSTIIAMQRLIARLDPTQLAGTVLVVPVLNVPSFLTMTPRVNPVDGQNMVGGFPGDAAGTQSGRAMAVATREVIARADAVIDFHDGDFDENMRAPFVAVVRGGRAAQDTASLRMALAFGLDHIVLYDRSVDAPGTGRSLSGQALVRGKAVMLVAAGRSGHVAASDLDAVVTGSLNVLGALNMLDRPVPRVAHPVWLDGAGPRIAADRPGVFFAAVAPDAQIVKGQLIGYVTDLLGRRTEDIHSPIDGVVMYVHGVPSLDVGVTVAEVLPILPELPAWKAPAAP